jgi:hypothetical protein
MRSVGEVMPLICIGIRIQDAWFGLGWATSDMAIIAAVPAIWFFRWD